MRSRFMQSPDKAMNSHLVEDFDIPHNVMYLV